MSRQPRRERRQQDYHYEHPLIHYGVLFGVGIVLSWIISETYSGHIDGFMGAVVEEMVLVFVVVAVLGLMTRNMF